MLGCSRNRGTMFNYYKMFKLSILMPNTFFTIYKQEKRNYLYYIIKKKIDFQLFSLDNGKKLKHVFKRIFIQ